MERTHTDRLTTNSLKTKGGRAEAYDKERGEGVGMRERAISDSNSSHETNKMELTLLDNRDQTILKRRGSSMTILLAWPVLVTFLTQLLLTP